ncbi:MAG: Ig-like domain-containing protein [Acidimicrobiales bacterium]
MEATLRRSAASSGAPVSLDVVWKAVALVAGIAAVVTAIVVTRPESTTAIQVRPAAVWLSGEARGRVVLAGARSERPSLAVQLGTDPSAPADGADPAAAAGGEYDLAEGGGGVFVLDRATGAVQVLDGRDGSQVTTATGPIATSERPQVVGAGITAYLVDPANSTVQRIDADGTTGDLVTVDQGFTDWAGAADGLLWLVNDADGSYLTFDGSALDRTPSFATPGTDLQLAVAGVEPVVVDPSSARLRWLRSNTSVDLGTAEAVLQDTDTAADCAAVLAGAVLSCHTPDGEVRSVRLPSTPAVDGLQLVANGTDAVLTRAGSARVDVVDWTDGSVQTLDRREPSPRRTVGSTVTGTVLVDDPGSQFAFSVDRGTYVELDKFSKRTIIIGQDATGDQGIGQIDEDADVAGVFTEDGDQTVEPDDNGVNDAPDANDDKAVTRVGRSITIDPLANDTDPEDDPLSISQLLDQVPPADGTAQVLNGTRIAYTPPTESADREISFRYEVADPGGLTSTATVTIEIIGSGRNSAPEMNDDQAETQLGQSVDVPVLDNDVDAEGDPLSIVKVGEAEHGTTAIGADGTVRYEPEPKFVGRDTFTYEVSDGFGAGGTAKVTVDVVEATTTDRPPVARDDRAFTTAGQRVRIEALANDDDPDGDNITIQSAGTLENVDISTVGNGAIDVVPSIDVAGLITFQYTIADDGGLTDTARVSVWVEAIATTAKAPIVVDDTATTASVAIPIDVVANDLDPNGGELTIDGFTQPSDGGTVVQLSPTVLQYTPVKVLQGSANVTFAYTVRNAANLTATANVVVSVTPPTGSGPVAKNDAKQAYPGDVVVVAPLANDSHPDGLPIDFAAPPTSGTGRVVVNADKTISFTPPDADPDTYTINYTIQDPNLRKSSATITITVVPRPDTNRPPIATNDVVQTGFNSPITIDVLANDEDPDGDAMRLDSFTQPNSGSTARQGNKVSYTPSATTTGVVTFSYVVSDEGGKTATGTVTVLVAERPKVAPIANDDFSTLIVGTTATVNPLANDVDPDGTGGGLSITGLSAPSGNGVTASLSGNQVRLAGVSVGQYTMRYTITDPDGVTANGTITVSVQPVPNNPPIALNDVGSTMQVPYAIDVLSNDNDPDGGAITLVGVTQPSPSGAGSTAVSGSRVVFTPSSSFTGQATFGYTIRDTNGATDTATVTVNVSACPALPTMPTITQNTRFNTPIPITLFGGGVPAGNTITVGTPNAGTASLQGGGASVLYTPPPTYNGQATFSYTARNTCDRSVSGSVIVTVNRAPSAVTDTLATPRNNQIASASVLGNDTDPDGDALVVDAVRNATGGTVSLSGQNIVFTPANNFTGVATFEYRVRDIGGLTSPYVTVRVNVANQAPVANPDTAAGFTAAAVTLNPLSNDTDPGDTLVVTAASLTAASAGTGTVTFTANSVTFTPATTFTIPDGSSSRSVTITYTVADGTGADALTDTATITVTINNRNPTTGPDTGAIDVFVTKTTTVDVLANDNDAETPNSGLTVTIVSVSAAGASATVSGGQVTYSHGTSTVTGPVIVTYQVRDANNGTAQGTLTVNVTDSTPPPPTTTTTTTTTTTPPAGP